MTDQARTLLNAALALPEAERALVAEGLLEASLPSRTSEPRMNGKPNSSDVTTNTSRIPRRAFPGPR